MLGKLIKYEWKGLRFPLMIMMIVLAGTMILTCGVIRRGRRPAVR